MSAAAVKTVKTKSSELHKPSPDSASATALTLSDIQRLFQDAVLRGDEAILSTILDNSRTTRKTLFGVYANAYVGRLVEVLQNEYPLAHAYCGDDQFRKLAETFVADCPSQTQNARWFGARLPEHLAQKLPYASYPELSELCAIERAASNAFDAEDAPVLNVTGLSEFAPETWPKLVFKPHPSVTKLDLSTNAFDIWRALKQDESPPAPSRDNAPARLAVWRQQTMPKLRVMTEEEAMMWTEAANGVRFEVLCEMVATFDDPDTAAVRAAGYLQGWLATEMLTAASLATPAKRTRQRSKK